MCEHVADDERDHDVPFVGDRSRDERHLDGGCAYVSLAKGVLCGSRRIVREVERFGEGRREHRQIVRNLLIESEGFGRRGECVTSDRHSERREGGVARSHERLGKGHGVAVEADVIVVVVDRGSGSREFEFRRVGEFRSGTGHPGLEGCCCGDDFEAGSRRIRRGDGPVEERLVGIVLERPACRCGIGPNQGIRIKTRR